MRETAKDMAGSVDLKFVSASLAIGAFTFTRATPSNRGRVWYSVQSQRPPHLVVLISEFPESSGFMSCDAIVDVF